MDPSMFDGVLVKSSRIIYTPSDFAKANLIHLQEVGELQARRAHTSKRENLSSYLFFMVLDGEGTLQYGGKNYALKKGDCAYVDCRKPYAHSSSENLWKLKWVHFFGPNMGGIYRKYQERGGRPAFALEDPERCETLLDQIYEIASSNTYIRDMQIFEKLTSLLTLLMGQSWNPGETGRGDRTDGGAQGSRGKSGGRSGQGYSGKKRNLQVIKEHLDEHYTEKISLDSLAETFFINKFYLTRIFKEQFGVSVTGYLQQVRITRAKQELRFTEKPIEEIAQECGMSDANYFSRVFKKVEGMSPGEFRKTW